MSQVSRKYGAQHAEMHSHISAAHRCKVAALAGALMLCPVIALPAESLRAPADKDYAIDRLLKRRDRPVLASLIEKAQGAMNESEHQSLRNRWLNLAPGGVFPREQVFFYGSAAAASIALLLLVAALLTIRRMRRQIAAKHDAKQRLQVSESRLRAAMEGTETGLWEWNPQTGEVYLDPVWFTMLGYTPDAMPHAFETFEALLHPDDREATLKTIAETVSKRHERYEAEFRLRHSDGSYRWINAKGRVLEAGPDGVRSRMIGVHTDVTERRRAEEQYRAFFTENISTVAWLEFKTPIPIELPVDEQVDRIFREGVIKDISEACAQDYGLAREAFLGQPITALWAPESFETNDSDLHQYMQQFIRSGYIDRSTEPSREITRLGEEKWFLVNMKGVIENGHLVRIWGSQSDVTESKLYAAERDELFNRLQRIAANFPGFIYQYRQRPDGSSHLEYVSGNLERVYGVTSAAVADDAAPIFDAIHPDDIERVLASIASSAKALAEWHQEYRVVHPSGRTIWAEGRSTPQKMLDGSIVWYGYQSDISERKQLDQRLQEYQQRLKSLAGQLTLAEERERRRIAADLHDDVGQLLALTRLQLAAARKGLPAEEPLAAQLEDISQSLLRAIRETRHLIFELSSPALDELGLGAAIADWSEEQASGRHGLDVEVFDHTRPLILDTDQRAIMFRNARELITNVIKHAQASALTIWLEQEDGELVVIIQDDGVGFDPATTLNRVDGEKGFGLFSIHERMTDLGGRLVLVSQPGGGCRASLHLPLQARKPEALA
ncbi:MAG: PAS domain-containing protein [Sedimenticolaceae bacterium]